jgi:hypothetical protein
VSVVCCQEGAVSGGVVSEEGLLFVDSMFKTLVMKHNTLMHRADVKRSAPLNPTHQTSPWPLSNR